MFGIDAAVVSAMTNHCPTDYRMHYSQTLKTRKKTKTLKLISHGKITSVLDIKDRKSIVLLFSFQKCLLPKKFSGRPPLLPTLVRSLSMSANPSAVTV